MIVSSVLVEVRAHATGSTQSIGPQSSRKSTSKPERRAASVASRRRRSRVCSSPARAMRLITRHSASRSDMSVAGGPTSSSSAWAEKLSTLLVNGSVRAEGVGLERTRSAAITPSSDAATADRVRVAMSGRRLRDRLLALLRAGSTGRHVPPGHPVRMRRASSADRGRRSGRGTKFGSVWAPPPVTTAQVARRRLARPARYRFWLTACG
jgi:hypothetical protein